MRDDADTKLEVAMMPVMFIRRAKWVAASVLTQAPDKPKRNRRPGKTARSAMNASRVVLPRSQKEISPGLTAKYGDPRKPATKRREP
jgi:hypothetical protein